MLFYIFSLEGCPFCANAEANAEKYNLNYKIIPVTRKTKHIFKRKLNQQTFPQIYLQLNKYPRSIRRVGGSVDFKNLLETFYGE